MRGKGSGEDEWVYTAEQRLSRPWLSRPMNSTYGRRLQWCLVTALLLPLLPLPVRPSSGGRDEPRTYLRVNQLGYRVNDAKVAVAFSSGLLPETFSVVGAEDRRVVFEG